MADPACGIQNRRDFLLASPRAGGQRGWIGVWGGELEPGAQLEPQSAGDLQLPPSPRQGYFTPASSPPPAEGPPPPPPPRGQPISWGSLGGPPEQADIRSRARTAWLSLPDGRLRPLAGNTIGLCKTRDRLWGKPGQLCSSSVAAVAVM